MFTTGATCTGNVSLELTVDKKEIANFYDDKSKINMNLPMENGYTEGEVRVKGEFLGRAVISFVMKKPEIKKLVDVNVVVIRA